MTPKRWERIGNLYRDALELQPEQREAFLNVACADDQDIRREIESLLAAEKQVGDFTEEYALKDTAILPAADHPPSSTSLLEGRMLGRYRIVSLLGTGGMGEVFLAHDSILERKVALKFLHADFTRDEERVRRFIQEAKAVSALNHPNIITIHEIGEADGRRYIATEFIEGLTLRHQLASARMSIPAVLDIAIQAANALSAAHTAGIVHRDIKPENIMVRPDGLIKVLDFGLAKLSERTIPTSATTVDLNSFMVPGFKTEPGTIMGTVSYMSPEQARGWVVDARSDIFSLGIVCYEMVTGNVPFTGETISHVIVAIIDQEPAPLSQHAPETPAEFQRIVSRALRKDCEERYQTVDEMLADFNALKQKIDMKDRTAPVEQVVPFDSSEAAGASSHQTGRAGASRTEGAIFARLLKSAEHSFNLLKSRRRSWFIALGAVIIAASILVFYFKREPALTEKDTVLLADFVNLTGDEVFDITLKQALAVQLEQTPFLNFLPQERIRETLRYMNRLPDERVTKDLAREICQRQGVKAFLVGSIARFDRRYSITLEAINSQNGDIIAGALFEAEGKDQVLRALGRVATQLRERLGESLSSIQKFDAPLEQATTSSLEALKAWSRGVELTRGGRGVDAIPLYNHAKDLDPNFAKAYVSLSLAYSNLGQLELAAGYAAEAFELRQRVTERERLDIESNYYALTNGDLLKAIEVVELWKQTYPRDATPPSRLASLYRLVGQLEKSLAAGREAHQRNSKAYAPYVGIWMALLQLNLFDQAQAIIEQALAQQLGTATSRRDLYKIALIKGDFAKMKQQIDWATGKPDEYWAHLWQAQTASMAGKLREARDFYRRAATLANQRYSERAAWFSEEPILREALCGLCEQVRNGSMKSPEPRRISLQAHVPVPASRALALALCGRTNQALSLSDEIARQNPHSTLANMIWLPVIRAASELQRGNPDRALQLLQTTNDYERSAMFWPAYLRGHAYLRLNTGAEAAVEFQKILDHRGWDPISPLYPLAQLGLARAAALMGDSARSRQAYESFMLQWKDADSGLPALKEAKIEYEKMKI